MAPGSGIGAVGLGTRVPWSCIAVHGLSTGDPRASTEAPESGPQAPRPGLQARGGTECSRRLGDY